MSTLGRRRFLKDSSRCLALFGGSAAGLSGCTVPPRSFRVKDTTGIVRVPLERYPELARPGGLLKVLFSQRRALFVRRTTPDSVDALSAVCTHQGCIVAPSTRGFKCPCHGSAFDDLGKRTGGPARAPLRRYRAELEEQAVVIYLREPAPAEG